MPPSFLPQFWKKNLYCTLPFWLLCALLFSIENNFGYNGVSALLFLLSVPIFIGVLAWVNRDLLRITPKLGMALSLYSGVVLLFSLVGVGLGLFGASFFHS